MVGWRNDSDWFDEIFLLFKQLWYTPIVTLLIFENGGNKWYKQSIWNKVMDK